MIIVGTNGQLIKWTDPCTIVFLHKPLLTNYSCLGLGVLFMRNSSHGPFWYYHAMLTIYWYRVSSCALMLRRRFNVMTAVLKSFTNLLLLDKASMSRLWTRSFLWLFSLHNRSLMSELMMLLALAAFILSPVRKFEADRLIADRLIADRLIADRLLHYKLW